MPFGLCNPLKTFQSYINNFLHEYLNVFCTTYLDNVLVYSTKKEEHTGHMLDVLKQLWDCGLQVDVDKCKFLVKRVKYFKLIISTDGISMDSKKVQYIFDWETSILVKDVQVFLGFFNFYCCCLVIFPKDQAFHQDHKRQSHCDQIKEKEDQIQRI